MLEQTETNRIFSPDIAFRDPLQNKLFSMAKGPIGQVCTLRATMRTAAELLRRFP